MLHIKSHRPMHWRYALEIWGNYFSFENIPWNCTHVNKMFVCSMVTVPYAIMWMIHACKSMHWGQAWHISSNHSLLTSQDISPILYWELFRELSVGKCLLSSFRVMSAGDPALKRQNPTALATVLYMFLQNIIVPITFWSRVRGGLVQLYCTRQDLLCWPTSQFY